MMKEERLEPRLGRKISRDEFADDSLPWNQAQTRLGVSRFGDRPNVYFDKPSVGRGAEGGSSYGSRNGFGSGFGGRSVAAGSNPGFGKAFTVQKPASLEYQEGDRVKHIKFGEGTVQQIQDGPKDFEVTVNFDRAGVKKMFASFAKLQKV